MQNGPLHFRNEFPRGWNGKRLPGSELLCYEGHLGTIVVQEIKTPQFVLRFFNLRLLSSLTLLSRLEQGWQSILSYKGQMDYSMHKQSFASLKDGQFLLFHAEDEEELKLRFWGGEETQFLAMLYQPEVYHSWKHLFPGLEGKDRSRLSLPSPIPCRTGLMDAVMALFYEKVEPYLIETYRGLKISESLFYMLLQTHHPLGGKVPTPWEDAAAAKAKELILKDLRVHLSNKEIAGALDIDRSTLSRAFRLAYGMGMHAFLIRARFELAKELLSQGLSLKQVAAKTGYKRSSTLSYEFRKYYGYSPIDFQKGRVGD
jgi:AraC-like DNA-binding protein